MVDLTWPSPWNLPLRNLSTREVLPVASLPSITTFILVSGLAAIATTLHNNTSQHGHNKFRGLQPVLHNHVWLLPSWAWAGVEAV